jgi:16S rRNA (guanine966-N2)-methyltransferase
MRIIGGKLKGRTVNPPLDYKARPTTDFAKEGLFNILNNEYEFEDLKVLDLFADPEQSLLNLHHVAHRLFIA